MREDLREMIRSYEHKKGQPSESVSPEFLAVIQVTVERHRAHYSLEEEAEYLKELDRYTRKICEDKEENYHGQKNDF